MNTRRFSPVLAFALLLVGASAWPAVASPEDTGELTRDIIIRSDALGYSLQYRVYIPAGHDEMSELPVMYVADGQWYVSEGGMPALLDQLIETKQIEPVLVVFVDNRNPANLGENRRNRQFFCNQNYVDFYRDELIPEIDSTYNTRADRSARGILGLSFGGLNSACFGLHAHDSFENIAMQSPAMHPVPTIHKAYQDSVRLPLKVFLSSGDRRDNEDHTRRLRDILQAKNYPLHYVEVPFAHNWNNWRPLLDDLLLFFYAINAETR